MRSRVLALAGAIALAGCEETEVVQPPPAPPAPAPKVDEVEPGELAAGHENAFGLQLPRGFVIRVKEALRIEAAGDVKFQDTNNYLRKRLDPERVETGPGKTVFTGVVLKNPERTYRIEVENEGSGILTRITLTDTTTRAMPEGYEELNTEQRWRRVGLTSEGKPAEPDKFE